MPDKKPASLDDVFMDKTVYVEVQLRGSGEGSVRTLLYQGKYAGTAVLADRDYLLLKQGWHYNRASISIRDTGSGGLDSAVLAIRLDDIVSIQDELPKQTKPAEPPGH
jgi:hypothetical protein